jgi:predicted PurR-regulated permease PerM
MSLYTLKQKKLAVLVATLLLGIFIAYALSPVFTAFLGAVIFYTLFKPLYIFLLQRLNFKPALAAVAILIISFLSIILPFTGLCLLVVDKVIWYKDHPEQINALLAQISNFAATKLNKDNVVEDTVLSLQQWALSTVTVAANGIANFFLKLTVMYFVFYFMLVDHERFERTLIKYMPFKEHNSMIFAMELKNITFSNILGQGIIAIVQGSLVGLGFLLFDLQDPMFWAVICVFLSFLPVVGSGLVFVPAGIVAISNGNMFAGIGILLWGFILVINIDNFMRMYIGKKFSDTHPLITIIGVVLGVPFFGILGLVFGPLLLSYFILLVRIYEIRYVYRKPLQISDLKVIEKQPGEK